MPPPPFDHPLPACIRLRLPNADRPDGLVLCFCGRLPPPPSILPPVLPSRAVWAAVPPMESCAAGSAAEGYKGGGDRPLVIFLSFFLACFYFDGATACGDGRGRRGERMWSRCWPLFFYEFSVLLLCERRGMGFVPHVPFPISCVCVVGGRPPDLVFFFCCYWPPPLFVFVQVFCCWGRWGRRWSSPLRNFLLDVSGLFLFLVTTSRRPHPPSTVAPAAAPTHPTRGVTAVGRTGAAAVWVPATERAAGCGPRRLGRHAACAGHRRNQPVDVRDRGKRTSPLRRGHLARGHRPSNPIALARLGHRPHTTRACPQGQR